MQLTEKKYIYKRRNHFEHVISDALLNESFIFNAYDDRWYYVVAVLSESASRPSCSGKKTERFTIISSNGEDLD